MPNQLSIALESKLNRAVLEQILQALNNPQKLVLNLASILWDVPNYSYDFDGVVLYRTNNNNISETMTITPYSGTYGHDWTLTLWNGNTLYLKMTGLKTADSHQSESGAPDKTVVLDTTAPYTLNYSSGNIWEVITPSNGIIPTNIPLDFDFLAYHSEQSELINSVDFKYHHKIVYSDSAIYFNFSSPNSGKWKMKDDEGNVKDGNWKYVNEILKFTESNNTIFRSFAPVNVNDLYSYLIN